MRTTFSIRSLAGALALGLVLGGTALAGPFQEANAERWGATYASMAPAKADPALCAQACASDARCRAWTYVKPGTRSKGPLCELKSAVPMVTASPCCVSGVTVGSFVTAK